MKKEQQPPPQPIVFRESVMLPSTEVGVLPKILAAGEASPYTSLDQVPEQLRRLIGQPREHEFNLGPIGLRLQHNIPRSVLENESAMIDALNRGDDLDPEIRRAIEHENRDYLASAQARNRTLTEIDERDTASHNQFVEEFEKENTEALKGTYE